MAQQQAYNANKGTLVPGQTISVNKFTVQVDRYLSQGGFAHVYLVRTPAPVYGTTHHVLKRIAVPNESMLSEVKKEVDIMRILKGHPNIVHLIDAAWHRMSNGMYEVFILMEFCAGGGIIDMMNRRLRERLTEAEILQIFVDVCEGVAAMHNLRPPLLHRDLKVENILQSSATSYKLCDFGSANPVAPRPPSSTQEIRALEADLNRHTTLQYRAPEMVDVYLRRPVDEKSDVWALGVLLYKLCYYTTPFEEHGPLAILNVQYKIPPYPVYSAQLNALIGSMLREHGAQRPSVFEVLNATHRMRGTKSKFTYDVPVRAALSPHTHAPNPLDSLVSYRSAAPTAQAPPSASPNKNAGVQAREKVLEAIAPMRRGRPTPLQASTSRPGSPSRDSRQESRRADRLLGAEFDNDFGVEEDETWKKAKNARGAVRGHRSGLASPDAWKTKHQMGIDDAWDVGRSADKDKERNRDKRKTAQGPMETGFGKGFGDSFDGMLSSSSAAAASAASASMVTDRPPSKPLSIPSKPVSAVGGSSDPSRRYPPLSTSKSKDAFDGLGLYSSEKPPAPTLGEARQARTGLAAPTDSHLSTSPSLSSSLNVPPANASSRPSSRPSPAPSPVQPLSWRPSPQPVQPKQSKSSDSDSAEERFPSLEELDRVYQVSSPPAPQLPDIATPPLPPRPTPRGPSNLTGGLKPPPASSQSKYAGDGVRSEHVTGAAMRESRRRSPGAGRASPTRRPALERRHRSSTSIRPAPAPVVAPPSPAQILGRAEPQDWLTGDEPREPGTPRLRDSPSKRASVIERSPVVQSPQEAVAGTPPKRAPSPPSPSPLPKGYKARMAAEKEREREGRKEREKEERKERRDKERPQVKTLDTLVSAPPVASRANSGAEKSALTENWSPVAPPAKYAPPMRRDTSSSSGGEEGPEDVNGFMPQRATPAGVFEFKQKVGEQKRSQAARAKGRQSSVHDLVDLWGGGPVTEKEKMEEPLRSAGVVNGPGAGVKEAGWGGATKETEELKKPIPLSSLGTNRSSSPQPFSRGLNREVEELKKPMPLASAGARSASPRPPCRPPSRGPSRPPSRGPSRPPSRGPAKETEALKKPTAFSSLDTMRSASPQPLASPAEPPEPATRLYSPVATRHRKQSTTSISSQAPISPVTSRPRPQSLFVSSGGGKPAPLLGRTTTTTATATLASPPDPHAGKSERRTSISNMVQRYEAMGGKPVVPATSTKPITKVATHGTSSAILSSHAHAPTPIQARSRSHFSPGASLGIPDDSPQRGDDPSRERTSPTGLPRTTPVGLPGLASDSRRPPAVLSGRQSPFRPPANEQFQRSASPAPAQRAPETPSRSAFTRSASPAPSPQKTLETPSRPTFARSASPAPAHHAQEEVPRSPSPEKPYQGVGRLIDQWQRKTGVEDEPKSPTAKRSAYAPKRAGVVGGKAR